MIKRVAEHYVDFNVLPCSRGYVIDIGCRGFEFTDAMRDLGNFVFAIDCDKLDRDDYSMIAISNYVGTAQVHYTSDPQATSILGSGRIGHIVICMTIEKYLSTMGLKSVDLIKLDCEGSEREIIMSLTSAPAKSLSIEFHLHLGIYGDKEVKEMEDKLISLGYTPIIHNKTNEYGAGFNYWSSLWVLKEFEDNAYVIQG